MEKGIQQDEKTSKLYGVRTISNGEISKDSYDIVIESGRLKSITKSIVDTGLYICPAYVDIHTHGAMGVDFSSVDQEKVDKISQYYFSHGITHVCPTFVATPLEVLEKQIDSLYSFNPSGALFLGAHIEGPYISPKKKGAQPLENIRTEFVSSDLNILDWIKDKLEIVTLCPATHNVLQLVRYLKENGVKVQGGHDDSNDKQIRECMKEGLDGVTHIFCACSTSRRDENFDRVLGMTECGLSFDGLTVEVIADNKHISQLLFEFILKCKTYRRVCLISDSLSCAGMPNGKYKLGEEDIVTDGKVCYLADMSALAGSVTSIDQMVRNVLSYGVELEQAVYMAAESPRKYVNYYVPKFDIGEQADYNVIDENGNVLATLFGQRKNINNRS